jgi:type IV secretory pathway VirB2 component (pilin)
MYSFPSHLTPLALVLAVWTIAWMGISLWKAAREGDELWFIVLLLVHTFGILNIIYYYLVSRKKKAK